jgi:hypothetical protein
MPIRRKMEEGRRKRGRGGEGERIGRFSIGQRNIQFKCTTAYTDEEREILISGFGVGE